jgi:uncharacterized membrane protein HdeD (DUF308 family)
MANLFRSLGSVTNTAFKGVSLWEKWPMWAGIAITLLIGAIMVLTGAIMLGKATTTPKDKDGKDVKKTPSIVVLILGLVFLIVGGFVAWWLYPRSIV